MEKESKKGKKLEDFLFDENLGDDLTNESMKLFESISKLFIKENVTPQMAFLTLSAMAESILAFSLIHPEVHDMSYKDFYEKEGWKMSE